MGDRVGILRVVSSFFSSGKKSFTCYFQGGTGEVRSANFGTLQGTSPYPTKREKENHRLKSAFLVGYVSYGILHTALGCPRKLGSKITAVSGL